MKILVAPSSIDAVGEYRIRQPLKALMEAEPTLDIEVVDRLPMLVDPDTHRILGFGEIHCDVLVLQLPMFGYAKEAIAELQSRGIKVVVELDDDYQRLHPMHMSYKSVVPAHNPDRNWRHLKAAARQADLVTCSTPALARAYGSHNAIVLRNYIEERHLAVPHHHSTLIGWAGAVGVHPDDLQVTRGGVSIAVRDLDTRFMCIGGGVQVREYLNLKEIEATKWVDFELYFPLLSKIGIGIVPLADTEFNSAKSWLKGLEYAAVGVPFVASDVAEYRALKSVGLKVPLCREKARDWAREIKLLADPSYAEDVSEHNRQVVSDHLTIEENCWRWAEAYETLGKDRARPYYSVT